MVIVIGDSDRLEREEGLMTFCNWDGVGMPNFEGEAAPLLNEGTEENDITAPELLLFLLLIY